MADTESALSKMRLMFSLAASRVMMIDQPWFMREPSTDSCISSDIKILRPRCRKFLNRNKEAIIIVGHSTGGAVATLAMLWLLGKREKLSHISPLFALLSVLLWWEMQGLGKHVAVKIGQANGLSKVRISFIQPAKSSVIVFSNTMDVARFCAEFAGCQIYDVLP